MRAVILLLASGLYLGYVPIASGTVGSLAGIPLFFAFDRLRPVSVTLYLLAFAALVLAACWVSGRADELLQEHDSHKIVIDEIAGYVAATLFLEPSWTHVALAFLVFRVFDIVKPFPAGYIDQHFPGGYGVTLDDVVSGLYANLVLRVADATGLTG
jgi:phosphatidylglycerophosphatase A